MGREFTLSIKGRGFGKILRALEENGSPKPEFETDENHSYFISRLFVHEAFLQEKESEHSQKGAEKELKRSRKGAKKRSQKKEPKESWIYCIDWKKIQR